MDAISLWAVKPSMEPPNAADNGYFADRGFDPALIALYVTRQL